MSSTFTYTFTVAEVRSRVQTDLRQLLLWYGRPTLVEIGNYGLELDVLLPGRFVQSIEYGFKRSERRVVSLLYVARYDGTLTAADNAGAVFRTADVAGASWFSFLNHSDAWSNATEYTRQQVRARLPFPRVSGFGPDDGDGYWVEDKRYGSGGVGLVRRTYRPR